MRQYFVGGCAMVLMVLPLAGACAAPPTSVETAREEDPYLWLEEIDSEEALAWVEEQNQRTAEHLKAHPEFESFYEEALAALNSSSRIPHVEQRGDYLYNLWQDDDHPRGIYRRTTLNELRRTSPTWETVLDVDALSAKEEQKWAFKGMDCLPKDYRNCLARLSPGGGDAVVLREFDMHTLTFVDDGFHLPKAKLEVDWLDAETLLVATDFGDGSLTDSGYPRVVKRWRRGTPLSEAKTLFEGKTDSVAVSAQRYRSDEGNLDLITEALTFWDSAYYQPLDGQTYRLDLPESAVVEDVFDGRLLVSLTEDWSIGRRTMTRGSVIVAAPEALRGGGDIGEDIELLLEPDVSSVVEEVHATPQGVLVTLLDNVRGRLVRFEPQADGGWHRRDIPFPDNGALEVSSTDDQTGSFFVEYEGFTTPPTLYFVQGPTWQAEVMKAQEETFDGDRFLVEQRFTQSADGTQVPYFLVHGKDTQFNGANPTHIFSYGGFRVSLTPSYSGSYEALFGAYGKLWLERGGVFVLANIRGGGEYGPDWHQAALLKNRHKAYEDFEAVAQDLIDGEVTSAEHLSIEGRSNGGLLVGAAVTRRPDLYGAAICGVPLLDMRRYHTLLAGASWMAEYGDPDDAEMWQYLKGYSPYHNLQDNTDYPPIFFFTSTRDDRVHPGHARKMVAKMLDQGHEVWYYENTEGGHGGSSTNDQLAYRLALAYAHLWSRLDDSPPAP